MRSHKLLYLGTAVGALASAGSAWAQEMPAPPEQVSSDPGEQPVDDTATPAAESFQELVVTGTRIVKNGFTAPTPVSVVTEAELQKAAPVTIADYVNQLPALQGGESPRAPRGNLAGGTAGANFLNLRNLGATRTLILLNGRRVTPSSVTGVTDINILPTALMKRIDVVTGGASAAWGSDAVSGVVNFVLDTDYTGLKGTVQGGTSTRGDAENFSGELSYGLSFADGRGHALVSGRYSKSYKANVNDRNWFKAHKIYANPAFAAGNGQPARIVVPYSSLLITDNGLIASGPLRGTFFDAAGAVAGTNFAFPPKVSGIFGGGSESVYSTLADQSRYSQVNVPVEQGNVYGRLSYELTDKLTTFFEGSYSKAQTETTIANFFRTGNTTILNDNFFVPTALRTAMAAAGVASVPLSTSNLKLGVLRSAVERDNVRLLGGIEGRFNDNWRYSAAYQYGKSNIDISSPNNFRPALYALAVDAVPNPANTSQPVCRSTLTNPSNGCIPLNPFGSAAVTDAQRSYLTGNSMQNLRYRQDVATASISGDLFELPAGALSLATGAEYRTEKAVANADSISIANGFFAGNYKPFRGKYDVKEAFAELAAPIFKDSPVGHSLDLNVAARVTDYSTSGSVVTWKAGATFSPVEDLQLRFTRSRDIRAPNLNELFQGGIVATQNVSDPFRNGGNTQFLQTTQGNANLKPEEADTLTAGVVFRPSALPGFGMSIDYYDIKIKKAIALNASQFTLNRCFAGDAVSCSQITRNAAGIITGITLQPFNALEEAARGVDVELSYRTAFAGGDIDFRTLLNYTSKLDIVTPTNVIRRAGEVGNNLGAGEGVPRVRALATATYTNGPFTGQLKGRFIGKSKLDRQWTELDVDRNNVPAIFYLDAYLGYKLDVGKGLELFVAGDNILDKSPPVVTNQDNSNLLTVGTNPYVYDVIGASFRIGARFAF